MSASKQSNFDIDISLVAYVWDRIIINVTERKFHESLERVSVGIPIKASMKMGGYESLFCLIFILIYIYSIYLPSANVIQPFTSFIQWNSVFYTYI